MWPGIIKLRLEPSPLLKVDTLATEEVTDTKEMLVDVGVGGGSGVDELAVILMSTTEDVAVVEIGLPTPGRRTLIFSRTSTPAASKTSEMGAWQ